MTTSLGAPLAAVVEGDQQNNQDGEATQHRAEHHVEGVVCNCRVRADHVQGADAVANVSVTMASIVLSVVGGRRRRRRVNRPLGLGCQDSAEFRSTLRSRGPI